jgi:HNH endonuclease
MVNKRKLSLKDHLLVKRQTDPVTGCQNWTGCKTNRGYGQIWTDNKNQSVHRVAYKLWVGPIPAGLHVLHKCDNPACFNPDHLFTGSRQDNMTDMVNKRRQSIGLSRPLAKLTEETAREIISLLNSNRTSRDVARQFGVSHTTILDIWNGKIWRHLCAYA